VVVARYRDPRGSAQWWARWISTVGVLCGAAVPIAALAGLPPIGFLDQTLVAIGGLVAYAVGIGLTLVSQAAMGSSWRPDVDPGAESELVTRGPFAIVRNPILLGAELTAVGIALLVPNVFSLVMVAAVITAHQIQVRLVEEPYLLNVHSSAYRRYAERTGRFVPGLGRWRPEPPSGRNPGAAER
jgi:protein-S-isoprenylcysteine O-methyltransferase Ste14